MSCHHFFWRQHPAFLLAITLLVAVCTVLTSGFFFKLTLPIIWFTYLIILKKHPLILLLLIMTGYSYLRCRPAPLSEAKVGVFSISSFQSYESPFHKGWSYKGTLLIPEGSFPCTIYAQNKKPTYKANCDYLVVGKCLPISTFSVIFKPKKWIPI